MSDEITRTIESFIHQVQRLRVQLSQIQGQRNDIRTELGKDAVRLGVREILGVTGGKYARKLLERTKRERESETRKHKSILCIGEMFNELEDF